MGDERLEDHRFVDLSQDYICQICMKVLQEPHYTECCGQHFCKACLEKWFEKKHGDKVCPHCREADFVHVLYKPLQRKINQLKIHCSNHELGCEVILKVEDISSHLSVSNPSGCGYVLIPCPNKCGQELLRVSIDYHIVGECPKRQETCSDCNLAMSHDLLDSHYEVCEEMKVSCPRNCREKVRRGDLKKHEVECPEMPVECPFSNAGCQVELTRKGVEEHLEKSNTIHLMQLAVGYTTLKASNSILKADLDSLRAENKSLAEKYDASRKDFATFKLQIAEEITRVKDFVEKPEMAMFLECVESSLRGYKLKSAADEIMFSVPKSLEIWHSPSFDVFQYTMCVVVEPSHRVELHLLKGAADGQLRWRKDLKASVTFVFYYTCTSDLAVRVTVAFGHLLNHWRDQEKVGELHIDGWPLYIGVCLEKDEAEEDEYVPPKIVKRSKKKERKKKTIYIED